MSGEEIRAKNLQSLLKFCLTVDDGTNTTQSNPDEIKEKAEWFQKFVKESSINFGQRMKEDIQLLNIAVDNNISDESVMVVLEELQDITENVDMAKDFIKMGAFDVIMRLIGMNIIDVTMEAAQLIGNVTQNDETCQISAINSGLVKFLLSKIESSNDGSEAKRLVYALSCCIRGSVRAIDEFKLMNGVTTILNAINAGNGEAAVKCAFLLFCITSENEQISLNEQELNAVIEKIVSFADLSQDGLEHFLGLVNLSLKRDLSMHRCCTSEFIERLKKYQLEAADKPEYEDSLNHIIEILNQLK